MNSQEVLRDNKKGIDRISAAIFNFLKPLADASNMEIKNEPSTVAVLDKEVNTLALLRLTSGKALGTYALGYSDPQFPKIWAEAFPQKPIDPASPTKTHEFELMKNFFVALETELKDKGYSIDAKSALIQEGATLGGWNKISVDQAIQIPITTKAGKLIFDIPIFNTEFAKKMTLDLYGFKDDARILVVDDSLVARRYSRTSLAMAGYFNIEECPDGGAAFTKIMSIRPPIALVVADWHMPVMSGLELLKRVRGTGEFKKLPLIMLTGEKNKEEVVSAIKEGATGYLVKPASPESFFNALRKAGGRA